MSIMRWVLLLCLPMMVVACGDEPPAKTASNNQSSQPVSREAAGEQNNNQNTNEQSSDTQSAQQEATDKDTQQEAVQAPEPSEPKAEVVAASLEEGRALYDKTCKVCHDAGLLDAPKLSAKADWQKRLSEKGLETLQQHSAQGFNKMPAQATGDVSEAQVYAAVNYILEQNK